MKQISLLLLISMMMISVLTAQKTVKQHIDQNLKVYVKAGDLTEQDIQDYVITDSYISKHNGVQHIYLNQRFAGIPIYLAINNINIKEGKVLLANNRFVKDIAAKADKNVTPSLSATDALREFALSEGALPDTHLPVLKSDGDRLIFAKTNFSNNEIPAQLYYYHDQASDRLILAWNLHVDLKGTVDYWDVMVDAHSGDIVNKNNFTVKCNADHVHGLGCSGHAGKKQLSSESKILYGNGVDGAQYRVYPFPGESPIHIDYQIVTNPADPIASPYGWHDTDGVDGPEYTFTRGNNAHAFLDQNDDNRSDDFEPDGGADLIFDFPHNTDEIPDSSNQADVTNLFYATNFMHDFSFAFGFDEESGNFQETNYSGVGGEGDYVLSNAQDGFALSGDNQGLNNATFGTPSDGFNPVMSMFQWNAPDPNSRVRITSPEQLAGDLESGEANYGRPVGTTPVNGKVVVVQDNVSSPFFTDGCEAYINAAQINGNIAMIDRGGCEFGSKSLRAEEAGAIAVIICNVAGAGGNGNELIGMAAGQDGASVSIPSLMLKRDDCDLIKLSIANGTPVELNLQRSENDNPGPSFLSSSFDNGIVAHEYGHGISNRLTGGPSNSSCLTNDEQMGEGWSDFYTLSTTHEIGDLGEDNRGIGNYVDTGDREGRGIRSQVYSTDRNINTKTLNDIRGTTSPHGLGEVWAATLWDMYWAFVEQYGYDPDLSNTESGNFRANQLVMDGMKFQSCSPGFLDGRDGILAADRANYNGDHQCMIWQIFADRGIGWDAVQGSNDSRGDNVEGFETFPPCVRELKIKKEVTELIEAGDDINVNITATNHKLDAVTNVQVTDIIPPNSILIESTVSQDFTVDGDQIIFELGTMETQDERMISYTLATDAAFESERFSVDDFESESNTLISFPITFTDIEWTLVDFDGFKSESCWYIENAPIENDQGLSTISPWTVQGELPALKFVHKMNSETGNDGGFVEISSDGGQFWERIPADAFIQGSYNSGISYNTFVIPSLVGFSGQYDWMESFIDLSAYLGEDILIRFRFGTDEAIAPDPSELPGWYIDNFELVDVKDIDFDGACILSDENDFACDSDFTNTLINTQPLVSNNEVLIESYEFVVSPNPTSNWLNAAFTAQSNGAGLLEVFTVDGRLMMQQSMDIASGRNQTQINVKSLPAGIYLLQLRYGTDLVTQKFIKN